MKYRVRLQWWYYLRHPFTARRTRRFREQVGQSYIDELEHKLFGSGETEAPKHHSVQGDGK